MQTSQGTAITIVLVNRQHTFESGIRDSVCVCVYGNAPSSLEMKPIMTA